MEKYKAKCPICGGTTHVVSVNEFIGIVEHYEDCETCSYIVRMSYSPTFQAICDEEPSERIERARAMQIEVLCREEYERAL